MASVAGAVEAALVSAFSAANAALDPASPDRISVYRALIPGVPTNRYCVIYAGEPRRSNSTVDGLSRDAEGMFQVTVAATSPNSGSSPAGQTDWLVKATLNALVDTTLTADGMQPFIVQQDYVDTYPVAVEVVPGRPTVEQALRFTFLSDRT